MAPGAPGAELEVRLEHSGQARKVRGGGVRGDGTQPDAVLSLSGSGRLAIPADRGDPSRGWKAGVRTWGPWHRAFQVAPGLSFLLGACPLSCRDVGAAERKRWTVSLREGHRLPAWAASGCG